MKFSPFAKRTLIKSYEKRASPIPPPPMPPQPPRAIQARFKALKPDTFNRKQQYKNAPSLQKKSSILSQSINLKQNSEQNQTKLEDLKSVNSSTLHETHNENRKVQQSEAN